MGKGEVAVNKRSQYLALIVIGIVIIIASYIFLKEEEQVLLKTLGLGVGLLVTSVSLSRFLLQNYLVKLTAEEQAEFRDKDNLRSVGMWNRAKAQAADFMQWASLVLAWITLIAHEPLWVTSIFFGMFVLKDFIVIHSMDRYHRDSKIE